MKTLPDDFSPLQSLLPSRSMGMKLILVAALALFMTIPSWFVWGILRDRTSSAAAATTQVANRQAAGKRSSAPPS
jgi:HAMP domain-containing protein